MPKRAPHRAESRRDDMPTHRAGRTEIDRWAEVAAPGDVHVYARTERGFVEVTSEVAAARKLGACGRAFLLQRRVRDAKGQPTAAIEYLAVRSSR